MERILTVPTIKITCMTLPSEDSKLRAHVRRPIQSACHSSLMRLCGIQLSSMTSRCGQRMAHSLLFGVWMIIWDMVATEITSSGGKVIRFKPPWILHACSRTVELTTPPSRRKAGPRWVSARLNPQWLKTQKDVSLAALFDKARANDEFFRAHCAPWSADEHVKGWCICLYPSDKMLNSIKTWGGWSK